MVKVISLLVGEQRCQGHSWLAEIQVPVAKPAVMVCGCGRTVVLMINRKANSVKEAVRLKMDLIC